MGRFGSWLELCEAVIDRSDTRLAPPVRAKLAAAAPLPRGGRAGGAGGAWTRRCSSTGPTRCPSTPAHPRKLAALSEQWGLGGSVDRLLKALADR